MLFDHHDKRIAGLRRIADAAWVHHERGLWPSGPRNDSGRYRSCRVLGASSRPLFEP